MSETTQPGGTRADRADAGAGTPAPTYAPPRMGGAPSSSRDPIGRYLEIIKDPELTETQKDWLIDRANRRFQNRRRMAYIALTALLVTLAVYLGGAIADGIWATKIVEKLENAAELLGVTNALLTSIVGAYYGFASLRPSS